jgi:hypothetical protein
VSGGGGDGDAESGSLRAWSGLRSSSGLYLETRCDVRVVGIILGMPIPEIPIVSRVADITRHDREVGLKSARRICPQSETIVRGFIN